jgi:hypothetical protein
MDRIQRVMKNARKLSENKGLFGQHALKLELRTMPTPSIQLTKVPTIPLLAIIEYRIIFPYF